MRPGITAIRPATRQEWTSAWSESQTATFFHSPLWYEIWETASQGKLRPAPLYARLEDGTDAVFVLAQRRSRLLLRTNWLSSPAGTYGGWLSTSPLDRYQVSTLTNDLISRFRHLTWRINPLDLEAVSAVARVSTPEDTQMLDLKDDFSSIFSRWSTGHRRSARRAQREGVQVRAAENILDWQEYYNVYTNSIKRWGTRATMVHPWSLFKTLSQTDSAAIRLWLATYDSRVIAGALTVRSLYHMSYWHGAALASWFKLRPVHLLFHEIIRTACDEGLRWFDFNPSGDLEGVRAFKRGFGAAPLPAPLVTVPRPRSP